MATLKLACDKRNADENPKHLRISKMIPAVVYGNHQEPISLKIDYSTFLKLFRKSGESSIITLVVEKEEIEVLVHELQYEPVSGDFKHIDFYALTRGEKLSTKIHIIFNGSAPAVKEGAIIEEHIKEIEVKCMPSHLVDHFDVDLTKLTNVGDVIRISDLGIDREKYEMHVNDEDPVVSAAAPKKEVEKVEEIVEEWEEGETVEADTEKKED